MGVFDKIKNALFEVEYIEVDEPQEEIKNKKSKRDKAIKEDKPIAKKIVLPGKREERVEKITEEDIVIPENNDESSKNISVDSSVNSKREDFLVMDETDFKVESDNSNSIVRDENIHVEKAVGRRSNRDDLSRKQDEIMNYDIPQKINSIDSEYVSVKKHNHDENSRDSKLYGVDSTYNVPVREYGAYEKKEEKVYFKPSPIISPIYGILDKNYKKEDVVQKKDIRLTTNYTRSNVSVDDVRNKAYGEKDDIKKEEEIVSNFEVDEDEEELLVDLSDRAKPEVKELTMGDALEYFQDLGLEYNVDYVDVSNKRGVSEPVNDSIPVIDRTIDINNDNDYENLNYGYTNDDEDDNIDGYSIDQYDDSPVLEDVIEDVIEEGYSEPKLTSMIEVNNDSNDDISLDDDDNLFDLIDSMYQENE